MQWVTVARLAVCVCLLGVWACGNDEAPPPKPRPQDGGEEYECIDEDGDGFGKYCDKGADCDDDDAQVTDECRRCATRRAGCPCEPGTEPVRCDPPDIEVDGGILVCSDGTRYCRDAKWSTCEVIGDYILIRN